MKRKHDTDEQIGFVLRQAETGTPIGEVCRKTGISEQTFYRWKKKFAGMGVWPRFGAEAVGRREPAAEDVGRRPNAG